MTIKQAYNNLSTKQFVNWCLNNKYSYFMVIEGKTERGWFWSKGNNPKQYKFNHQTN